MDARLSKLRSALADENLDAIIVTQPENRRYLSGFTGSSALLLITPTDALLATDFRYYEQVAREAPGFCLVKIESPEIGALLNDSIHEVGAKRVGFESQHVTFDTHRKWTEAAEDLEYIPTEGMVEKLRSVKEQGEIDTIRRAVALSDSAIKHIRETIQPGMTEKQVAWELEVYMRTRGAQQVAFETIAGSGPNGALPHVKPTDREVRAGEPIVMDLGARVDGYNSDVTRTICIGEPDDRFQEIYGIVLKAQLAAEEAIRPGMLGKDADAVAREVISEAGYGEYFGHALGHGVGLAVHEKPGAGKTSEDELLPGCAVTVEPGIYIPDWGGVRIEDLVVVTDGGIEVLTQASKDPVVQR
jgi:Xaa-Pro aminopeptidase